MASFTQVPAKNKQGYKWVCTKEGPPDPVSGKRNQIARRADTKKEAEARVDKVLKALKEDGINEKKNKNLPFIHVAEEWLETYKRTKVKKNTIRLRGNSIATLNKYIKNLNIDKITPKKHQSILNDLFDKGYAKSTIEGVHVTANLIYKHAIKEKYRKDNPATGATIPVKRRTVEEIEANPIEEKYLESHELTEFLNAVRKYGLDQDKEMFYLLAFTGMRIGEALALKWTDINFETHRIRVTKTMYNENNNMREFELQPPKTDASIRDFDVDEDITNMLQNHYKTQTKLKMATRHLLPEYYDSNFVFTHDNGYPLVYKHIANRMERVMRKTNIHKHATSHIFRHTHVSMMAEAGVDLATIMARVGHDDPKTTLQIYTHVTKKMEKNATQKVKIVFADLLKAAALQEM
ncbi:tyrosine-type recombinase/integrase [Paenibacillus sp. PL2-23]|uniref:tyrosine-type recombinase/integrase n=1 Tax=Paenibacillus sp. PL2-23 TaxID=2100729 RepID=UPI0030FAA6CE